MKKIKIQFSAVNLIISILFSIACVLGFCAKNYGEVKFGSLWLYAGFVGIALLTYILVNVIWRWIDVLLTRKYRITKSNAIIGNDEQAIGRQVSDRQINNKHTWFKSTATIWLLNFIVFLGVYPGFFCYDAQDELMETITRCFNNQHPMLHVLSMGGIVQFFHKITGSYNIGIAAFILFQMTIIAVVLGFAVKFLSYEGVGRKWQIVLSIYFGFFPVLVMYSLCSSKDGVFGAFLVLSVIKLRQLIMNPEDFFGGKKKRNILTLAISLILMMLMRNNGVYAFFVFTLVLVIVGVKNSFIRKYIKNILIIFLVAIISFGVLNTGMLKVANYKDVGHKEILTVPIQQLARLYSFDQDSLSNEDISKITKYIPKEALRRYDPKCSDMVKVDFNEDNYLEDSKGFYDIWLSLGVKHPAAYVNAFVMTSYGLYYPWAIIDGYKDHEMFTYTYGDSSYFGYEVEPPGERKSFIPFVDDFYRWISLDVNAQKIPILHLLLSPGFMLWLYLILIGYLIDKKDIREVLAYLLPFIVIMTCLIGPMSLVRYSFYLWIFIPMLVFDMKTLLEEK